LFAESFAISWAIRQLPVFRTSSLVTEVLQIGMLTVFAAQPVLLALFVMRAGFSRKTLLHELAAIFLALLLTSKRVPVAVQVTAIGAIAVTLGVEIRDSQDPFEAGFFLSTSYYD
jgi:hypothetical protein